MDTNKTLLDGLYSVTEEIIGADEFINYLTRKEELNHYIGFEISGQVHFGTGLMSGLVVRELQKLGIHTSYLLADWHTWINNKFQGDRAFIKQVAEEYFEPALLLGAKIAGADEKKIKINLGSSLYHNNDMYWQSLVDISKSLTVARIMKSTAIMGRNDSETMPFGFMLYPPMQVADIFELKASIAHAGMDQRKVHVIAREVAEKLTINPMIDSSQNHMKPIAIHHRLLLGLQKPAIWPIPEGMEKSVIRMQMKMSKSVPGSAIFIHDSIDDITRKIKKAFCPDREIVLNPLLDWTKHIIFPITGLVVIKREERWGGNFTANTFEELETRYASGDLSAIDLKNSITQILIEILTPAREYFSNHDSQILLTKMTEKQSR